MSNTILIKRSGTANAIPGAGNLALGELAINYNDGNLFYKDGGGTVETIASKKLVDVSGNITGGNVLTGGIVSAAGNIISGSGSYFIGNGSQLTGVSATTSTALNNGNTSITTNLNANANVTIAGTSNVIVWASTGQYVTGLMSVSGNVTGGNILTIGLISSTGTITSADTITGGNLATGGTASATGNITGGNVLTGGLISATGNITGGNASKLAAITQDVVAGDIASC